MPSTLVNIYMHKITGIPGVPMLELFQCYIDRPPPGSVMKQEKGNVLPKKRTWRTFPQPKKALLRHQGACTRLGSGQPVTGPKNSTKLKAAVGMEQKQNLGSCLELAPAAAKA
ncbi:hypothetical protein GWK47_050186 [Chionoecetes opilio]|uniref:Uncharacterized protein n=1 Tax=Chionoecetes opilio TaxID=41210 RepID=A0A8J5CEH7_CHIOP|nr:hypothetical protein GWK47_050186 [Chionoecetes opilio]